MENLSALDAFLELDKISDEEALKMLKRKVVRESATVSVNASATELEDAKKILNSSEDTEDIDLEVIDADADAVEHLKSKSDYIGDFLLQCSKCHAVHFANANDLEADPEVDNLYNVDDECPNCHESGAGFSIVGQVGKASTAAEEEATEEDMEEELPAIENDGSEEFSEIAFDNDLEEEPTEENDEENNTEPFNASEEPAVDSFEDEEEDDGMSVDKADDSDEEIELPSFADDDEEEEKKDKKRNEELEEEFAGIKSVAHEAFIMNKVIEAFGDEDAYLEWIATYPDGCSEEDCKFYFGEDDGAFEDLEDTFNTIYSEYHEDGLDNPDEETLEYAKKKDIELGLSEIKANYFEAVQKVREAFGYNSLDDFLHLIHDAENINTIVVKNNAGGVLYKGSFDNLQDELKYLEADFQSFDAAEGIVTFGIDSEETHGTRLKDLLAVFADSTTNKISIVENDEEVFNGDKEDALKEYGEAILLFIQIPDRLTVTIDAENNIGPEIAEESLFEAICSVNGLRAYRSDNAGSTEYFLKESLDNAEDLDEVYQQYVFGHKDLEKRFKEQFHYRDAIDEAQIQMYGYTLDEQLAAKSSSEQLNAGGEAIDKALVTAGIKAETATSNIDPEKSILIAFAQAEDRLKAHQIVNKTLTDMGWEAEINRDVDEGDVKGIQLGKIRQTSIIGATNESYRNRKELSAAIAKLKEANIPYKVTRSLKEGYRYDVVAEAKKSTPYDKLLAMKAQLEDGVEESLNEAKKDELPPDPTAIKIEAQQAINNLASEQIGTAQEVSEVIQELSEKPIEYKDEIISDLEALKDAALDNVEALNATATKITFTRKNHTTIPVATDEPAVESLEEAVIGSDENGNDIEGEDPENVPESPAETRVTLTGIEGEAMREIARIADTTSKAIKDNYDVDVPVSFIVADILQDLKLISGDITPEDLEDTPINNVTKVMFDNYNQVYELIDDIVTFFTGKEFHSTPVTKLTQAIRSLSSEAFSDNSIKKAIASPSFAELAAAGQVPYIEGENIAALEAHVNEAYNPDDAANDLRDAEAAEKEEEQEILDNTVCGYAIKVIGGYLTPDNTVAGVDEAQIFDSEEEAREYAEDFEDAEIVSVCVEDMALDDFDDEVNNYFDEAYEDTVAYTTTCCESIDNNILMHGIVRLNDTESDITFTLTPKQSELTEAAHAENNTQAYNVSNDLSDETFELTL